MTYDGTDAGALWQGWLQTFREGARRAYVSGEIDRDAFDDASAVLAHVQHRTDAPNARRATYRELRNCGVPSDRLAVRTADDTVPE